VNGLYKALRWIDKASPAEVADAVPEQYHLGDKALYTFDDRFVKKAAATN
jgi:NitT/TauT family transport system substrate-binding protein